METRRSFFIKSVLTLAAFQFTKTYAKDISAQEILLSSHSGNFDYIYSNNNMRDQFSLFLKNVFNLYPEVDFHNKIFSNTQKLKLDPKIYQITQSELSSLKPLLGDLTYSIPALIKQKKIMSKQTSELLNKSKQYDSYLEIGSTGRYLDLLEEEISIGNERYFISDVDSSYSPVDMIDRGQVLKAGNTILLNNYQTDYFSVIPKKSLDLATVYIGFHHCPINLREEFIGNLRDCMKTGSILIVRDHNVIDMDMLKMVCLAHDVFNMGTGVAIKNNESELRNFYSLDFIIGYLEKSGFKFNGKKLLQEGDPTKNTLMSFQKV